MSYGKNLKSSLKFTLKSVARRNLSNLFKNIEANEAIINKGQDIRQNIREANSISEGIKKSMSSSSQSKVSENIDFAKQSTSDLLKNAISDMKSGQLNNQKRVEEANEQAMADFFDMDMSEFDFDDDEFDVGTSTEVDEGKVNVTKNDKKTLNQQTNTINNQTVNNSPVNVTNVTQGTSGKMQELGASISGSVLSMGSNINRSITMTNSVLRTMLEFQLETTTDYYSTSLSFYESSLTAFEDLNSSINKMVDETEKRNNYFGIGKDKGSGPKEKAINRIIGSDGSFNFLEYFKYVTQSATSGGGMADMIKMGIKEIVANPVGRAMTAIFDNMIPEGFKDSLQQFDSIINSLPQTFLLQMERLKDSTDNKFFKKILDVMGVGDIMQGGPDFGGYEKGAVPFDGITKRSITHTIPSLLSKILSAVRGDSSELVYDYDKGTFTTKKNIKKEFREKEQKEAGGSLLTDASSRFGYGMSDEEKEELNEIFTNISKAGKMFDPNDKNYSAEDYNLNEDQMGLMKNYWNDLDNDEMFQMQKRIMEGNRNLNDLYTEAGESSTYAAAFDTDNIKDQQGSGGKNKSIFKSVTDVIPKYLARIYYSLSSYDDNLVTRELIQGDFDAGKMEKLVRKNEIKGIAGKNKDEEENSMVTTYKPDKKSSTDKLRERLQNQNEEKEDSGFLGDQISRGRGKIDAIKESVQKMYSAPFDFVSENVIDPMNQKITDLFFAHEDGTKTSLIDSMKDNLFNPMKTGFKNLLFGMDTPEGLEIDSPDLGGWSPFGIKGLFGDFADSFDGLKTSLKKFMFGDKNAEDDDDKTGWLNGEYAKAAGIGGALSLFLPGGPLIGAGLGLFSRTDEMKDMISSTKDFLFGDKGDEIDPDNPKKSMFKFASDDQKDQFKQLGISSGVGILSSFILPGGPLLGALGGLAFNTRSVQNWLFGESDEDTGILDKIGMSDKEDLKKAGISSGIGVLSSFILPGGPLLGALTGFALQTDQAKEFLFGTEDEEGFLNKIGYNEDSIQGVKIGAGVGALTGLIMPGGPLLGSLLGVASQSEIVKDYLFGEDGELTKRGIDEKQAKKMGISGGVGALVGLSMPGGPVIGGLLGIATQTDQFKDFMFGDDGILTSINISRDKLKQLGIGAGGGALASLVLPGGPVIGGLLGIATQTEYFDDFMFGEDGIATSIGLSKEDMKQRGMGAGVGALAWMGMPGGPVLGGLLGLATQTDVFKEAVFGSKDKEGLIDKLGSSKDDLKKRGITGVSSGLLASFFLPGGPLIGGLVGLVTQTKAFREGVFGDEGILTKAMDKLKGFGKDLTTAIFGDEDNESIIKKGGALKKAIGDKLVDNDLRKSFSNTVNKVFSSAKDSDSSPFSINLGGDLTNSAKDSALKAIDSMKDMTSAVAGTAKDMSANIKDKTTTKLSDVKETITTKVSDVIDTIKDRDIDNNEKIDAISNNSDFIKEAIGIDSESTISNRLANIDKNTNKNEELLKQIELNTRGLGDPSADPAQEGKAGSSWIGKAKDFVKGVVTHPVKWVKNAIGGVFKGIKNNLKRIFIDPIVKTLKGVTSLVKGLGKGIKEIYNVSKAVIGEVYNVGKSVITTAGSFLKDSVIKPLGTLIGETFKGAIKGAVKTVEYFGRAVDTVVDGVFKGLDILKDAFFEAGKTVMSFAKATGSLVRDGLGMLSSGVSKVIGRDKRKSLGSVYVEGGVLDKVKEVVRIDTSKSSNSSGINKDSWADKRRQARANEELETEKTENKLLGSIDKGIGKITGEGEGDGLFSDIGAELGATLIGDTSGEFIGTLIGDTAGEAGGGILGGIIANSALQGAGSLLLNASGIGAGIMGVLDFFKGLGKADDWFEENTGSNKVFSGIGAFFSGSEDGTSNIVKNAIKWGMAGGAIAGIGSFGVATPVGFGLGAALGAGLGYIGGEKTSHAFKAVGDKFVDFTNFMANGLLGGSEKDDESTIMERMYETDGLRGLILGATAGFPFGGPVGSVIGGILGYMGPKGIVDNVSTLGTGILSGTIWLKDTVTDMFNGLESEDKDERMKSFGEISTVLAGALTGGAIGTGLMPGIGTVLGAGIGAIGTVGIIDITEKLGKKLKSGVEWLKDTVSDKVESIKENFKESSDEEKGIMVMKGATGISGALVGGALGTMLMPGIGTILGAALGGFGATKLVDLGVVVGNKMKDMYDSITDKFSSLKKSFTERDDLQDRKESDVNDELKDQSGISGLINGMSAGWYFSGVTGALWSGLLGFMPSSIFSVISTITGSISSVFGGIKDKWNDIKNRMGEIKDGMIDGLNKLPFINIGGDEEDSEIAKAQKDKTSIIESFSSFSTGISNFFTNKLQEVKDGAGSWINKINPFSKDEPKNNHSINTENSNLETVTGKSYNMGDIASHYESGGAGAGIISSGRGDHGGKSYGPYQLSSKQKTLHSFVNNFLPNKDKAIYNELMLNTDPSTTRNKRNRKVAIASDDFDKNWRKVAKKYPERFRALQSQFIKESHYDPMKRRFKSELGIDLDNKSKALREAVFSTAVQHGAGTSLINNAGITSDMSDKDIIKAIYNERGKRNKDGELAYFSSSSSAVQKGVYNRLLGKRSEGNELENVLALYDQEQTTARSTSTSDYVDKYTKDGEVLAAVNETIKASNEMNEEDRQLKKELIEVTKELLNFNKEINDNLREDLQNRLGEEQDIKDLSSQQVDILTQLVQMINKSETEQEQNSLQSAISMLFGNMNDGNVSGSKNTKYEDKIATG